MLTSLGRKSAGSGFESLAAHIYRGHSVGRGPSSIAVAAEPTSGVENLCAGKHQRDDSHNEAH